MPASNATENSQTCLTGTYLGYIQPGSFIDGTLQCSSYAGALVKPKQDLDSDAGFSEAHFGKEYSNNNILDIKNIKK
jgi:hypothetical protein